MRFAPTKQCWSSALMTDPLARLREACASVAVEGTAGVAFLTSEVTATTSAIVTREIAINEEVDLHFGAKRLTARLSSVEGSAAFLTVGPGHGIPPLKVGAPERETSAYLYGHLRETRFWIALPVSIIDLHGRDFKNEPAIVLHKTIDVDIDGWGGAPLYAAGRVIGILQYRHGAHLLFAHRIANTMEPIARRPTRASLRQALLHVLRQESEMAAFCLDYFDLSFPNGLTQEEMINHLFRSRADCVEVLAKLRRGREKAIARLEREGLLEFEVPDEEGV